jgi:hypothetical protein
MDYNSKGHMYEVSIVVNKYKNWTKKNKMKEELSRYHVKISLSSMSRIWDVFVLGLLIHVKNLREFMAYHESFV